MGAIGLFGLSAWVQGFYRGLFVILGDAIGQVIRRRSRRLGVSALAARPSFAAPPKLASALFV